MDARNTYPKGGKMTEENGAPKESTNQLPKSNDSVVEVKPKEMTCQQLANFMMQRSYALLNTESLSEKEYCFARELLCLGSEFVLNQMVRR